MLIDWSDDYLIGISEIDAQHQEFFKAGHKLYEEIMNCQGENIAEETVSFLRSYAEKHFSDEEAFMANNGYPKLEEHKKLHKHFFESFDAIIDECKTFGPTQDLADKVLELIQDWLIEHITYEDTQYADYIKNSKS